MTGRKSSAVGRKPVLRVAVHRHRFGADELAVVVVVPRRNAEHDAIARVDERAVHRVDRRPCAGRDEHGLDRKLERRDGDGRSRAPRVATTPCRSAAGTSTRRRAARRRCASSSSRGMRNCFELKSPTVMSTICFPSLTSARTSPAIPKIAEPRRPVARRETLMRRKLRPAASWRKGRSAGEWVRPHRRPTRPH